MSVWMYLPVYLRFWNRLFNPNLTDEIKCYKKEEATKNTGEIFSGTLWAQFVRSIVFTKAYSLLAFIQTAKDWLKEEWPGSNVACLVHILICKMRMMIQYQALSLPKFWNMESRHCVLCEKIEAINITVYLNSSHLRQTPYKMFSNLSCPRINLINMHQMSLASLCHHRTHSTKMGGCFFISIFFNYRNYSV